MAVSNISFKMPQEPCPLPSLDSDEESFVVLGKSIPDCGNDESVSPIDLSVLAEAKKIINNELEALEQSQQKGDTKETTDVNLQISGQMESSTKLPHLPSMDKGFETGNSAISIVSITDNMSSEEIQNKISEIIEENVHLKNTILQNNISLKSQYDIITTWQEDVQKVVQAHREKLLEAKSCNENYKKENENLKRDLSKAADETAYLKTQINDLKRLIKEKEHSTNEVLVQRSDDNLKEFQLEVANKKIKDLESLFEDLTLDNKKLVDETDRLRSQDKEVVERLTKSEDTVAKLTLESSLLKEKHIQLLDQYNVQKETTETLQQEYQKLMDRFTTTKNQLDEVNQQLLIKSQREESLVISASNFKAQLDTSNQLTEELINLRTQLSETQTKLTQVEISRTQAYAHVNHLSQELALIKRQLSELQAQAQVAQIPSVDSSDVYALQAQLEIYKADFADERNAREVIKGEKDRLEEDIQNLQRRNQQLQEEIEILRSEQTFVINPSSGRAERTHTTASSRPSPQRENPVYSCPKCGFRFNNIAQLESHVNRCLDLDDQLP